MRRIPRCSPKSHNLVKLVITIAFFAVGLSDTSVKAESAISYITVAKGREIGNVSDCSQTTQPSVDFWTEPDLSAMAEAERAYLTAIGQELTDHGIRFTWARHAASNGGLIMVAGCTYKHTLLYAFEIPLESFEQAQALGFKHWSEWPNPVFTSLPEVALSADRPLLSETEAPLIAKSSGPLLCNGQGKPTSQFAFAQETSKELTRAGIPVDQTFCAILPAYPPHGICGEDSGKLDVFKIPASSITRARALGFQLAGSNAEGEIGELKEISCLEVSATADTLPCASGAAIPDTHAPAALSDTVTGQVFDIRLSGTPKNLAKLRNMLGKAVARGILTTYTLVDATENQFSACVELTDDKASDRFDALVATLKSKGKSRLPTAVAVSERLTPCASTEPLHAP